MTASIFDLVAERRSRSREVDPFAPACPYGRPLLSGIDPFAPAPRTRNAPRRLPSATIVQFRPPRL